MSRNNEQFRTSTAQTRQNIRDDVAAFLASGKKIEQIPTGVSSHNPLAGRKHLVLGKSKNKTETTT
jgi:hypothetical protein